MIKTIFGAAIVVATLSTGAQAASMGQKMMMHKGDNMMMHKNPHMIKMQCKAFKHYAHGKCESTMNKYK